MKKKFKPVDKFIFKAGFDADDFVKAFADSQDNGWDRLLLVAKAEGQLCGSTKGSSDLIDFLKVHYRQEGMWLMLNDLVEPDKKGEKKSKEAKYCG